MSVARLLVAISACALVAFAAHPVDSANQVEPQLGFVQTRLPMPGVSNTMEVADINSDGRPDLIFLEDRTNHLAVLINTTPLGGRIPSFAAATRLDLGSLPGALAVGDLDGDQRPDLVVGSRDADRVLVVRNTTSTGAASATFAPGSSIPVTDVAVGSGITSIAIGDLNGDGRHDLAITHLFDVLDILLNTTVGGTISFTQPQPLNFAVSQVDGVTVPAVAMADFNGDGRLDLAVSSGQRLRYQKVSFLFNTTTAGALTASFVRNDVASSALNNNLTVGDIDGDGRPDLVGDAQSTDNWVITFLNRTQTGAMIPNIASSKQHIVDNPTVVAADFDGDGRADLGVSTTNIFSPPGKVHILLSRTEQSSATASFAPDIEIVTNAPGDGIVAADVNGDTRIDAIVANPDTSSRGSIMVLLSSNEYRVYLPLVQRGS